MVSSAAVKADDAIFFERLQTAAQRTLLLDYDGTLAPFTVDRAHAYPYGGVPELLESIISGCDTRVVFVSGRTAREIPPLLGLKSMPEVFGAHGLDHLRPDGTCEQAYISDKVQHALAEGEAWLEEEGLLGVAESKPGGIAVHWRGLREHEMAEVRTNAYRVLSWLSRNTGLNLAEFDGGLELRTNIRNKGDVVRRILSESGPDTAVAYLGDDLTDEDAFRALGDAGLTVLVRERFRPTQAHIWIKPPEELIHFLDQWVRACRGER